MHRDNNDNGDNDDKLQMALTFGVELKNEPEHRIHIVAMLYWGRWHRSSWSTELCVKKRLCIEINEFFT